MKHCKIAEVILGFSAFYHDSTTALIVDDEIIAAAHEERYIRQKHDSFFPHHAVACVLDEAELELSDITAVAFYDKPYLKFERLLETYHSFASEGLMSFLSAIPAWINEKLLMRQILRQKFKNSAALTPTFCSRSITSPMRLAPSTHHRS